MWYFGVLLYQLCTLDGQTLWKVDQADNISQAELLDLAFRWVLVYFLRPCFLRMSLPPRPIHPCCLQYSFRRARRLCVL